VTAGSAFGFQIPRLKVFSILQVVYSNIQIENTVRSAARTNNQAASAAPLKSVIPSVTPAAPSPTVHAANMRGGSFLVANLSISSVAAAPVSPAQDECHIFLRLS
jgi:hypothetical protein